MCRLMPTLLEVATSNLPLNKHTHGARERKAAQCLKLKQNPEDTIRAERTSAAQETLNLLVEDLQAGTLPSAAHID